MHTSSWSEHLSITRQVLDRVKSTGLTVKSSKCYVGDISVGFIDIKQGFLFTQQDTDEKLLKPPIPRTTTQIRAFHGLMVGYYSRFLPKYASIAAPLRDLTKQDYLLK